MDLDIVTGPESSDAGSVADLAPRSTRPRRKRRWSAPVVLAALLAVGGFVAFKGLRNASMYFCNVDEVGVKTGCSPTDRFRLQGVVQAGSVKKDGAFTNFIVEYNNKKIPVHHEGDPPELFRENIPVVLEGSIVSGIFDSNLVMVKHSETYRANNPDRVPANAP
jgi:cytochrome c-type biogenesis protein CcmE